MRGTQKITFAALLGVLLVAACTERTEKLRFDGNYYPTRSKAADKADRQSFVTSVRRASQGLDGARESGRVGGVRYCIENYGTSDIVWTQGPDAEEAKLVLSNGNLVLRGRCVTW